MGIGLFSAGAECLAPITITDIFFVSNRATRDTFGRSYYAPLTQAHERGTYMGEELQSAVTSQKVAKAQTLAGFYTVFLSVGVSGGIIVSGLIVHGESRTSVVST